MNLAFWPGLGGGALSLAEIAPALAERGIDACAFDSRRNTTIEAMALEGMRREGQDVLPPFDADELEQIVRGYEAYDAPAELSALDDDLPVLLVVANADPGHAASHDELLERFRRLVPRGEVRQVDSGHDLIWGLGPALGDVIGEWLHSEVAA